MAARELYFFLDPDELEKSITVKQIREAIIGRHDNERIVLATGLYEAPYVPLLGISGSENRLVLEL